MSSKRFLEDDKLRSAGFLLPPGLKRLMADGIEPAVFEVRVGQWVSHEILFTYAIDLGEVSKATLCKCKYWYLGETYHVSISHQRSTRLGYIGEHQKAGPSFVSEKGQL